MHNTIVVNTLEFESELKSGTLQEDLFERISEMGANAVEVRREFINDFDRELPNISKNAQKFNLEVFYSIPEVLFINGKVNPKLPNYLNESKLMGSKAAKFNIGDYSHFRGNLGQALKELTSSGIQINIENDQSTTSGKIAPINKFLVDATDQGIDIGYVYDLGNWRYVQEDENTAAEILGKYTRYIHLKDVSLVNDKPTVVPLDDGIIDWKSILAILPKDVPIAIEYPAENDTTIKNGIEKVKMAII